MDDAARRALFDSALSTEYFVLQGVSGSTVAESSSRSSLYLLSLSSGLVALGFVTGSAPEAFGPFAAAVLPTLLLLGTFTVVRLVDTSVENIRALRGMARIRRYYASLVPEGALFFAIGADVADDARAQLGVRSSPLLLLFTMASMIGTVNAVLGGTTAALALTTLAGLPTPAAIGAGVGVAVLLVAVALGYQALRFREAFPAERADGVE